MKKNRNELEKFIYTIIQELSSRKQRSEFISKFAQHGILSGTVEDILKGMILISTVPVPMLCLITKYLYEVSKDPRLNYENYFTEFEVEQAKSYKYSNEKEESDVIIFENITKDAEGDFSGILTIQRNAEMWEQMLFRYNPETQRPLIVKDFIGGEYKEPYLNLKTKTQITKRIIEGKQISNTITINVLDDGENTIEYDEKNRRLMVYGKCDLIDGYHRSISAWFAYQKKSNSNFYFKLRIVNWDIDDAKEFIHQESLGNKLDPLKAKSYNTVSAYHKIISRINEYNKSNLNNKITSDTDEIKKGNALISFNTIFDGLKYIYPSLKDNDTKTIIQTQNLIVNKLNLITSYKTDLLENVVDDRVWLAYLIIIKKYNEEDDIINAVDNLDVEKLLEVPYRAVNKKLMNDIEKLIKVEVALNV